MEINVVFKPFPPRRAMDIGQRTVLPQIRQGTQNTGCPGRFFLRAGFQAKTPGQKATQPIKRQIMIGLQLTTAFQEQIQGRIPIRPVQQV